MLAACDSESIESKELPQISKEGVTNELRGLQKIDSRLSVEEPNLIASYIATDDGLIEYSFADDLATAQTSDKFFGQLVPSYDETSATLATYLRARNNTLKEYYESSEFTATASPTSCLVLKDGCFFLVDSKPSYSFNAVYTQVRLPSRARGDIKVEEDNFSQCPNNRSTRYEIPYIFLGGHSQGVFYQNIDAGLQWNCGFDNWSLFTLTSDNSNAYTVSTWRLNANQVVKLWFYVNPSNSPVIVAYGTWKSTTGQIITGTITFTCNTSSCTRRNWSYSGYDTNYKLEINLAQGYKTSSGSVVKQSNYTSGARFANTNVQSLYLGNYNSNTKTWTNARAWNINSSKTNSIYTASQCIIPGIPRYIIQGTTNTSKSFLVGANISLQLPTQ
jgi:hypothetical protein